MANGHSCTCLRIHLRRHNDKHGRKNEDGIKEDPQSKPVAPRGENDTGPPAIPVPSPWTDPIADPNGGPICWLARLNARGSYIPAVSQNKE